MRNIAVFLGLVFVGAAEAATAPACLRQNQAMSDFNNRQVLSWKSSSRNQYHDRAYINGTIVGVLLERKSHLQLEVDLDPSRELGTEDHIEIVYNKEFGRIPNYRFGSQIIVCGDYITSNAPSGRYPASPMGALIHWVHMSPNAGRHPDGYMVIDGVLVGMDNPHDNSKDSKDNNRRRQRNLFQIEYRP